MQLIHTQQHTHSSPKQGMTWLIICLVVMVVMMGFARDVWANPRYASIVVDADTGRVLHADNADAVRHPASLTKMMTLYMTFDALKRGKLKLRQRLSVSKYAASKPQTNIGLRRGDRITVEQAIRALVVRSANDVSVVLGEAISGSEWKFAVAMTNRARRIGLRRTVFKNANGLPDRRQVTTARDMYKLGRALRRHFPQYYHYFKATRFSYKGRTYNSHNRVLKEYPGVDGIKTGYINMSGFNLVTSLRRNGYSLIAVVLGGKTSRSRDAHMKDLLTRSLRKLSKSRKPIKRKKRSALGDKWSGIPEPALKPDGTKEALFMDTSPKVEPPQKHAKAIAKGGWGVQVGAFSDSSAALLAAVSAQGMAKNMLENADVNVLDPPSGEDHIYRARIEGLTEINARKACGVLIEKKQPCFVYQIK